MVGREGILVRKSVVIRVERRKRKVFLVLLFLFNCFYICKNFEGPTFLESL